MYGARYGSYGSSETVALPSGMGPGAVIGKGAGNIKMLGQRTGARFDVRANSVVITGSSSAVAEGVKMLKEQISAFTGQGGGYPHPLQVLYLLEEGFGTSESSAVFRRADGEVARATDRSEELFHLVPAAPLLASSAGGRPLGDAADALAGLLAGVKLQGQGPSLQRQLLPRQGQATAATTFLLQAEDGAVEMVRGLVAALAKGGAHTPAFDEIKLRFNWGKALFYKGPYPGEQLTLARLQCRRIPEDFKSVYSNGVVASRAAGMAARLQAACPGLRLAASKESVSLHLVHRRSNAGYAVSMLRVNGSPRLELRKLKASTSKLFFLTWMSGKGASEDWRAKLMGVYSGAGRAGGGQEQGGIPPAVAAQLRELAQRCRLAGADLDAPSKVLLHAADMDLEKLRLKSKKTYLGVIKLPSSGREMLVKVNVSVVTGPGNTRFTEVGGCSPDLNADLAAALASGGRLAAGETVRLQERLAALMAFARRVSEGQ